MPSQSRDAPRRSGKIASGGKVGVSSLSGFEQKNEKAAFHTRSVGTTYADSTWTLERLTKRQNAAMLFVGRFLKALRA
jgi:hypothetical protein